MLRIGYLSAALNLVTALVSFLRLGTNYALVIMISYTLIFFIGYRLLRTRGSLNLIPLITVSCFFLIYNVVYVLFKQLQLIDLYVVGWRLEVQLLLPLLIGLLLKAIIGRSGKSRLV